jgi:GT2 family glycosyltransferase
LGLGNPYSHELEHRGVDVNKAQRHASIVVLTHNRCHLLRQCVENVLMRTSERTSEIVIWDNASNDGTSAYLDDLTDPRVTIIRHRTNIGVNAYARLFPRMSGDYLIVLDDDVIEAPPLWDRTLVEAFETLPNIGYLAANLAHNPHDITSEVMYGINAGLYRTEEVNGVRLKVGGPVGGWCSVTSRELYDRVGGLSEQKDAYWLEDGVLLERLSDLGYGCACLEDLHVVHASGPHYAPTPPEKLAYWRSYNRTVARKNAIKNLLLRLPGVSTLNARHGWFQPPRKGPDYVRLYDDATAAEGRAARGNN